MDNTPTSAETAEVKAEPAAKQTREAKVIAGMKEAWGKLKVSDKQWVQTGLAFGKWCSELRKLTKKQGSRKGLGFEATVRKHGVNFEKARYWADEVEGKNKKKARDYAVAAVPPKKNDKPKGNGDKPEPFVLLGLTDEQQDAMAHMETDAKGFSQFAYKVIVEPGAEQVRFVVERCLSKFDKLQDQLDLLADVRGWIDRQCFALQDEIEAGITTVQERKPVAFLDEDVTSESAGELGALIKKARETSDANTNAPEPGGPAEVVVPEPEVAEAAAGGM